MEHPEWRDLRSPLPLSGNAGTIRSFNKKQTGGRPVKLNIINEYDPLEAVLVHRPGDEIERLTHDNMRAFLFEDIPYLTRMQDEHDEFVAAMRGKGVHVVYLADLIGELIRTHPDAKRRLIVKVCAAERNTGLVEELLNEKNFPADVLLSVFFNGITHGEYAERTGRRPSTVKPHQTFVLPPIPNAYFNRDPAVVIGSAIVSCKMHYPERVREAILTRAVMEDHPEFTGSPILFGSTKHPEEDRPFTIEGGDVIVLNAEAVLVGTSERTRSETTEVLARKAFERSAVKRFYEIPIPGERTFMHLDTVFTIVDRGMVVWYPGVMENLQFIHRYESDGSGGVSRIVESRNLEGILSDEFGRPLKVVRTGGGSEHFASREQRTDGTNILALAPRVACTYERNQRTVAAMRDAGIDVIAVVGSELVRGLGGPRCMTMPLRRRGN